MWLSGHWPAAAGVLFGTQTLSHVPGALRVGQQRVSGQYDPGDSGYLPENGPPPEALRVPAGQDHRPAAAAQQDRWR